ncbi:MAG TPA: HD domain-containing protein [Solirubrobacterales bacterium]|nr:HD domain-containing protein [Solirubrobacterales bacterium]
MPPTPTIEAAAERSQLVGRALATAREAHAGQIRNGSGGRPYIEHPLAVAERVAEAGYGDEVLAAALLHDVVEDSELTVADLRERFDETVAALVAVLSDEEAIESYADRKAEHRARVAAHGEPALAIYAADKLANVATLRRAYGRQGEEVGAEFKAPLDLKLEVWEADLGMLLRQAPELAFPPLLRVELDELRAERRTLPSPG